MKTLAFVVLILVSFNASAGPKSVERCMIQSDFSKAALASVKHNVSHNDAIDRLMDLAAANGSIKDSYTFMWIIDKAYAIEPEQLYHPQITETFADEILAACLTEMFG